MVRRWEDCPHGFRRLEMLHTLVCLVATFEHLDVGCISLCEKFIVIRHEVTGGQLVVTKCAGQIIKFLLSLGSESLESDRGM